MNIYSSKNVFIDNKYTKWYFLIIENAKLQNRIKSKENYYELHHILPKSIYPEIKENSNLIYLTAREHFICHWLLTKMIDGKEKYKMFKALHKMSQKCSNNRKISSFEYEVARKYNSIYMIENNPAKRKEVREKMSIARTGKKSSIETREKLSKNNSRYWQNKKSVLKGTKFYNNGNEHKMFSPEKVPEGWVLGRINSAWNKGIKTK